MSPTAQYRNPFLKLHNLLQMVYYLLLVALSFAALMKYELVSLSDYCPKRTKGDLSSSTDKAIRVLYEFEPYFSVVSKKSIYESSICSARFALSKEGKWRAAVTSFTFQGHSRLSTSINSPYAGIESGVRTSSGSQGGIHTSGFASISFESPFGAKLFTKTHQISPESLRWSECSSILEVVFDTSIILESEEDYNYLNIRSQEIGFSIERCD
jgi:hypothetical protein